MMIPTVPLWLCWMVPAAITVSRLDANPSLFVYDWMKGSAKCRTDYFQNKRVWITGASSGIGAELARQLHQHGAHLLLSSRKEETLLQVQQNLHQNHNGSSSIQVLPLDVTVTDEKVWEDIFENAKLDDIDIIILNAGLGQLSPAIPESNLEDSVTTCREETNRRIMEVNYWGPVRMTERILLQKRKKRPLHIVITSSVAAKMAVPLSSSYAASKHALHGYFTSLRSEVSSSVRIDLPCPGPVDTNFHQNINSNSNDVPLLPQTSKTSNSKMPVQRCAQLLIASMMGPSNLMHETWISRQPTLFFTYLSQYAPGLSNLLLNQIGKLRLRAHQSGLPLYEPSTWFKVAFQPNSLQNQDS